MIWFCFILARTIQSEACLLAAVAQNTDNDSLMWAPACPAWSPLMTVAGSLCHCANTRLSLNTWSSSYISLQLYSTPTQGRSHKCFLSPGLYPKVTKLTFLENILFMLLCHLRCHDFRFCLSLKRLLRVYASNDCFPGKFAVWRWQ